MQYEITQVEGFDGTKRDCQFTCDGQEIKGHCAGLFVHEIVHEPIKEKPEDAGKMAVLNLPVYSHPALLVTPNAMPADEAQEKQKGQWFRFDCVTRFRLV